MRPDFLNFHVDHMTLLVQPQMYNVAYAIFRLIFGVPKEELLYEKRKEWVKGQGEESMTFAVRIGSGVGNNPNLINTIFAIVQPTEPKDVGSHVRDILDSKRTAAHWQHVALRTSDLMAFHQHALQHGVNFITPILKDESEDLIQVFSGEWFPPGMQPSGLFFEFVQRNPTPDLLRKLEERNRESWFRDKTFLGLYSEKENEYRRGQVKPFLDPELFTAMNEFLGGKKVWEITDEDLKKCQAMMKQHAHCQTRK